MNQSQVSSYWDINVATIVKSGALLSSDGYKEKYGYLYRKNGKLDKHGLALLNTFKLDLKDYPTLGDFRTIDSTALRQINGNINESRAQTVCAFILDIGGYFKDQEHPQLVEFQLQKQDMLFKYISSCGEAPRLSGHQKRHY